MQQGRQVHLGLHHTSTITSNSTAQQVLTDFRPTACIFFPPAPSRSILSNTKPLSLSPLYNHITYPYLSGELATADCLPTVGTHQFQLGSSPPVSGTSALKFITRDKVGQQEAKDPGNKQLAQAWYYSTDETKNIERDTFPSFFSVYFQSLFSPSPLSLLLLVPCPQGPSLPQFRH